jgi:hypothetical protein
MKSYTAKDHRLQYSYIAMFSFTRTDPALPGICACRDVT